jgi:nanoRNase/pAp phosphatase (c-di-AMP/oligoRNAs hydrolase)
MFMARWSAEVAQTIPSPASLRLRRSDRFLAAVQRAERVVFVSHVQPDPDSLGSMLGLAQLVQEKLNLPSVLTQEGGIFRAENRALVDLLHLDLLPLEQYVRLPGDAVVMVDSQPGTGRHNLAKVGTVTAVIDHHVTPGDLTGVVYQDIRPDLGATCTLVLKYLSEQKLTIPDKLATALLYGIETELSGFPREATPADDDAIGLLFQLADKDLLAQIRHARLPKSHFDVLSQALEQATLHDKLIITWVDALAQPEQAAEVVDLLIRFEQADWAICAGVHGKKLVFSVRAARANARAGELLHAAIGDLGNAGGHERRAGGCITLAEQSASALAKLRSEVTKRLVTAFGAAASPTVPFVQGSSSGREPAV